MANKAILFSSLSTIVSKLATKFVKVSDTVTHNTISIDSTPTASSTNLVTSGGVYAMIGNIESTLDAIIGGS